MVDGVDEGSKSFGTDASFEPTGVQPVPGQKDTSGKFEWRQVDTTDEFDPWGSSFPEHQEPVGVRPNWWIVATAVLALLVLVLLVVLVFRGRGDDELPAPAAPVLTTTTANSSTTTTGLTSDGTISSVLITETAAPTTCLTSNGGDGQPLQAFLNAALAQQGKPYKFESIAEPTDPSPASFDTSELVEWAAAQAGVEIVDGSWFQYQALTACGSVVPVEEALATPGALLFGFPSDPTGTERPPGAFVSISLGFEDKMIDATADGGVAIYPASSRTITHGALIPNMGQGDAEYLP